MIKKKAGANLSWIYDVEGEDGLRAREENVIDEVTQKSNIVLSTGGEAMALPLSSVTRLCRGAENPHAGNGALETITLFIFSLTSLILAKLVNIQTPS